MQLTGKRVAVVGLGKSGTEAARLCLRQGAKVTLFDEAPAERVEKAVAPLRALGASVVCGPLNAAALGHNDMVVVSPGVPPRGALDAVEATGREVIGELELASRYVTAPIALVGGTNGKSTVTAWTCAMLQAAGQKAFAGGNFGTPLSEAVGGAFDSLVVEISSFQAERVPTMRARVHALLNISEDHLDRYDDFAGYARAKGNPFENMTSADVAVIPYGDDACLAQAKRGSASLLSFGEDVRADVHVADGHIVDRTTAARYPVARLRVRGRHNVANACAAVAVARSLGAEPPAIESALATFAGLAHRNVLVAEVGGVSYYNDSKATNVGAVVAALNGMSEPRAVLIAGGRDKEGDYAPLVAALRERGRALVVIGEAAERIAQAAGNDIEVVRADDVRQAVHVASHLAKSGDGVLLSPACSSYDMFTSYKARGDAFVEAVRDYQQQADMQEATQ